MKRYHKISQVLWIIFIANIVVAAIKMMLGFLLHITSLSADGFHAITDSASNIIALIGIRYASKPADSKHPYGHSKYETIASLIIGFLLASITFQIATNAITWFLEPTTPTITLPSILILCGTFVINLFVAIIEYRAGKKLQSEVIIADSIHTRSDLFISLGVITTMILIPLGAPPIIDPLLSIVIAFMVGRACFQILKSSLAILVDQTSVNQEEIRKLVQDSDKEIIDVHKIRSREIEDTIFIDLHLIVSPNKTVQSAHDLSHKIQSLLNLHFQKNVELIAHIEPDESPVHLM